ncbi:MAG: hypothetical protein DRO23_08130 [Thermoprotei archaeon]|nr:MAG: hypothetical protein DRO23_08130 [Thermoprotei archaeon]
MNWENIEKELYMDFGYKPESFNYRLEHAFHDIIKYLSSSKGKLLIITYPYGKKTPEVDGVLGSAALTLAFRILNLRSVIISTPKTLRYIITIMKHINLAAVKEGYLVPYSVRNDYIKNIRTSFNILVKEKPLMAFIIGRQSKLKPLETIVNLLLKTRIPYFTICKLGYCEGSLKVLRYPVINLALYTLGNVLSMRSSGKIAYNELLEKELYRKLVPNILQPYFVYKHGVGKVRLSIEMIVSKINKINYLIT